MISSHPFTEANPNGGWGASIQGRDPELLLAHSSRSPPAARPTSFFTPRGTASPWRVAFPPRRD